MMCVAVVVAAFCVVEIDEKSNRCAKKAKRGQKKTTVRCLN
jgi:hypothetical protein